MAHATRKALGIGGMIAPFVLALLVILFKKYFAWLDQELLYEAAGSLLVLGILHVSFVMLALVFKTPLLKNAVRYLYVVFLLYLVYITGDINSSFIFTLLLPIIAAAVHLDSKATRNLGIVTTVAFAALIFVIPMIPAIDLVVKHVIQTILLGAISYLIYRAVTETMQKEETDKRISEIVQMDRLKSDFLSIAQHQLRTPLSGVKWALEMLKADTSISLDSQSLIDQSLARVNDSLGIINQMLTTVEDEGAPALKIEPVDLVGIVQGLIAELNFMIVKKKVKINFFNAPQSLMVPADRNKLKAALLNVIDNAVKYSPQGTVDITITEAPQNATLVVKDTGIGIPGDDLPYIFERLHRSKNAVMLEPDESGVGLSITRKIISLHGGTINVDSEPGKGTTITVILPKAN
jgi:signal transduction histidine kinase